MPLYEYQCKQCSHRLEKIQHYSAKTTMKCPVCGGQMERLISAPAIRFKGSGFYETDYAHNSSTQVAGHSQAAESNDSGTTPAAASTSTSKENTGTPSTTNGGSSSADKGTPAKAAAAPAAASS